MLLLVFANEGSFVPIPSPPAVMLPQPASGTYTYEPAASDLVLEAFSRIQVRSASLTREHTWNAFMSASLMLQEWSIRPTWPNLWKIELLSIPLAQGVPTYAVPRNVVAILDAYIREFQTGNPVNINQAFSTVSGSNSVSIQISNNGLVVGNQVNIVCPVAIGGIVLLGQYTVAAIGSNNSLMINAANAATATVSAGGVVPEFITAYNSASVTVSLPNHGLSVGFAFSVQIPTLVGGLILSGVYTVATVIDANTFTISAGIPATATTSTFENNGYAQVQTQPNSAIVSDLVVTPISRTEYANQPNKLMQARPTTFWFDRLINPTLTVWPVADNNGLYTLYYYAMTQIEDFNMQGGTTLDLPARFLEAFAAGLAEKLAWKYPPPPQTGVTIQMIKMRADEAWDWASRQDDEQQVNLFMTPGLGSYYRY